MVAAPLPAAGNRPTGTLARGRFTAPGKGASGKVHDSLHYLQFRPLGADERPEDRALFGPALDWMSWRVGQQEILEHTSRRVLFHRIILSPGPEQEIGDMQGWTRLVMADLGRSLGQELHWVAVVHRNTDNPHVHVLVGGAGERHGVLEPVILRRPDYDLLRQRGDQHAYWLSRQEGTFSRALDHEVALDSAWRAAQAQARAEEPAPGFQDTPDQAVTPDRSDGRGR